MTPSLRSPCGAQVVWYLRTLEGVRVTTLSYTDSGASSVDVEAMSAEAARDDWREAVGLGFTVRGNRE